MVQCRPAAVPALLLSCLVLIDAGCSSKSGDGAGSGGEAGTPGSGGAAGGAAGGGVAGAGGASPGVSCEASKFALGVPKSYSTNTTEDSNFSGLGAGDVDGDGDLDLVAGSSTKVWAFLNDGDGKFGEPISSPHTPGTGSLLEASTIRLADVDGDGLLDMLGYG